jgi:CRISPR-associated endonuclease/helicase Cas3
LHFGLLNNDCVWVFDEIQLMGNGLATTAQLAAFREQFQTFGTCYSIWMSATLDQEWLRTVDFAPSIDTLATLELSVADHTEPTLAKRLTAPKEIALAPSECRTPEGLAAFVKANHTLGTQTLVVVNRVARARETFIALEKQYGLMPGKNRKKVPIVAADTEAPELCLLHSRFRPYERKEWPQLLSEKLGENGRIILATQVIEAGVDMTSQLLITDLAPYASLVQRFGRCNRGGEYSTAHIYWIDRPLNEKDAKLSSKDSLDKKEQERIALPYTWQELETARMLLMNMQSAAPPTCLVIMIYLCPHMFCAVATSSICLIPHPICPATIWISHALCVGVKSAMSQWPGVYLVRVLRRTTRRVQSVTSYAQSPSVTSKYFSKAKIVQASIARHGDGTPLTAPGNASVATNCAPV